MSVNLWLSDVEYLDGKLRKTTRYRKVDVVGNVLETGEARTDAAGVTTFLPDTDVLALVLTLNRCGE